MRPSSCLILWAALLAAAPLPAQGWEIRDNCDEASEPIKILKMPTQEDCLKACESTSTCGGIVYTTGWKRCQLKTTIKQPAKLRFISGTLNDKRAFDPESLKPDHDHNGKDIERKVLDKAEDCGKACEERADCEAFTYLEGYRVCWLKAKGGKLSEKIFRCGIRR